jgi:WD40 repeat protein/DNA-binding SARP family transcriptional activator/type II secretory pathway predicted ATPase ExeA
LEAAGDMTSQQLHFRILGTVEVAGARGLRPIGGPKQRAVLAHLLLRTGTVVSSERLIEAVWDGTPPSAARGSLQAYVSNLRRALGRERIDGRSGGYVLHADRDEVDAQRFVALVDRAAATSPARPTERAALLGEALALWRGPALDDLADQPAFQPEAIALNERRASAREDWISARLAIGEHSAVVATIEPLLDADPLRERLWEQLIAALYLSGRQADALRAYQRAREVLRRELGVDPSPQLERMHEMVLAHDLSLEALHPPLRGYRLAARTQESGVTTRWRARQPGVDRDVHIEAIGPPLANDPMFVRRFDSDARAVSAVHHPFIVGPLDWWREPDAAYLVFPAMTGTTLAARLEEGDVDRTAAARIMAQVREAVGAAHRRGIAHGALDPDAIVLDDNGTAHVTWYTIGRVAQRDDDTIAADDDAVAKLASALGTDAAAEVPAVGTSRRAPNPYKGLRTFDEADAPDFFGRAAAVAQLVERLASGDRFLAVVGPSGAGKSSLVRAGLIPAVRRGATTDSEHWPIVVVVPGAAPFEDLAAALLSVARERQPNLATRLAAAPNALRETVEHLSPDGGELLLVIDQFEELFVVVGEEARDTFIDSLVSAITGADSRLRVVVTLRADFFDRPLRHATLGRLLTSHTIVVPPPTPAEVAVAITGPAERAGAEVEPALVAQVVGEIADRPGALPLLQYALTEMYDRESGLTLDSYRAVDGLAGALTGRAEQVLSDLAPPARAAARQLFLRLVAVGEGSGDVRRRLHRSDLVALTRDTAAMEQAIAAFGAARLLTFDRDPETRAPTVEVAHEALLTQWTRLRTWITATRDDLVVERRLAAATGEWLSAGRDPSFLASGHRLDRFSELASTAAVAITTAERAYVDASQAERQRREDAEAARRAAELRARQRSRRRRRALLGSAALVVVVVLGLGAFAVQQRTIVAREARVTSARQLAAAAIASLEIDPQRGLLLAIEAVERTRSVDGTAIPEAEAALRQAIWSSRLLATLDGARGPVAWSPTGDVVATGSADAPGVVHLRDPATFAVVAELQAHDGVVTGAAFSHDGARLATTGNDGVVGIWRTGTGARIHEVAVAGDSAQAPAFSADDRSVTAVLPDDEIVAVIDTRRGRVTDEVATRGAAQSAALATNGTLLYSSVDGTERLVASYSVRDDRVVFSTEPNPDSDGLALSPDGRWLATSSAILHADTGVPLTAFEVSPGIVPSWSTDGRWVVTGGLAGTAVVRELAGDGELRERATLVPPVADALVVAATMAPDGSAVLTVDDDGAVHAWGTGDGARPEVALLPADTNESATAWPGIGWAPDSSRLAVSAGDGDVSIWRTDTWTVDRTIAHGRRANVNSIAWSPDGALLATVGRRKAKVWDARTGRLVVEVPYAWQWAEVVWTPDGRHLAVVAGQIAEVIDRSGRQVARVLAGGGEVWGSSFNRDGSLLALAVNSFGQRAASQRPGPTADGQGLVAVWDWRSNELVASVDLGLGDATVVTSMDRALVSSVSFDPTGDRLVVIAGVGARVLTPGEDQLGALLVGDAEPFNDVTFAPDGRSIASAGTDGIVRLWDPDSGEELVPLHGHGGTVDQVEFSPDGRWLASSNNHDGVRVWALRIGDLLDIARSKVTRDLTPDECAQYAPDTTCP